MVELVLNPGPSLAELDSRLTQDEWKKKFINFTPTQLRDMCYDWSYWSREKQRPPDMPWFIWMILAGRGFGKSRTGAEWVRGMMCGDTPLTGGKVKHMALVAETYADARKVMIGDGLPENGETKGILQVCHPDFRPVYNSGLKRLTWPNGAIATHYTAQEPDELRGPQHGAAWCDELAKWFYLKDTWDMLMFGLRQGDNPQVCVTTTPRPLPLVKQIIADKRTYVTRGSMYENVTNLPLQFLEEIKSKYEGTRLGRQEIAAEVLDDFPGALWTRDLIESCRIKPNQMPELKRIGVGVDPSGTSGHGDDKANEVGIVRAGVGVDGILYILKDVTCSLSPAGWGRRTVETLGDDGDIIVAEKNFGGAMVMHVIQTADKDAPVKMVTASKGKIARAEPVAALFEQGKAKLVGSFPEMEDQMCACTPDGYVEEGSPDRVDAMVWIAHELMLRKPWMDRPIPVGLPIVQTY